MERQDRSKVINGYDIFNLIESFNISLKQINLDLRKKNLTFDFFSFCFAARNNNWKIHKTHDVLKNSYEKEEYKKVEDVITISILKAYSTSHI